MLIDYLYVFFGEDYTFCPFLGWVIFFFFVCVGYLFIVEVEEFFILNTGSLSRFVICKYFSYPMGGSLFLNAI